MGATVISKAGHCIVTEIPYDERSRTRLACFFCLVDYRLVLANNNPKVSS
ncbi:MAG: hypothetical protein KME28_01770 [Pelatocladus maniniholoensis HA4357-MV3]|uniref:Uncharacterized protein n=1 Tax=Pelatocladus maniniholoensis HA4357-MV3 TaxID=1117104 RepID=A0A9E3H4X7_9NOST|nr:hypothetical protein [Pelatocladus maniniholoensis HA4357-MV3]